MGNERKAEKKKKKKETAAINDGGERRRGRTRRFSLGPCFFFFHNDDARADGTVYCFVQYDGYSGFAIPGVDVTSPTSRLLLFAYLSIPAVQEHARPAFPHCRMHHLEMRMHSFRSL